jgi:hypothetical protein
VTCDRWVVFTRYSGFLHQWNWPPRYNWNIVERGLKHHKPTKPCVFNTTFNHISSASVMSGYNACGLWCSKSWVRASISYIQKTIALIFASRIHFSRLTFITYEPNHMLFIALTLYFAVQVTNTCVRCVVNSWSILIFNLFSPHIFMEFGYLHLCSGRIVSQTWISYIIYIM